VSLKILLAIDGSLYSEMATKTLKALQPRAGTEVTVMTVVPEHTFLGKITLRMFSGDAAATERAYKTQEQKAAELLQEPLETLRASGVNVETLVCWGKPAEQIIRQAHEMRADLVMIGAKGAGDPARFPLGSVAQKVMKYADTSVLLAREGTTIIRRVLFATDGSKYSDAVAGFLLDLPLPSQSQVIILTALQSHMPAMVEMPTLDLETNRKPLAELRAAEEGAAQSLMAKTKKQFQEKGYDTQSLVLPGDPAEEILITAETLNPELIAVGAKGLTAIEAFLLGSVAQRVARFSRYSVLIVRTPRR
jgi:nucleotide-binding universal stress UspA family protein